MLAKRVVILAALEILLARLKRTINAQFRIAAQGRLKIAARVYAGESGKVNAGLQPPADIIGQHQM